MNLVDKIFIEFFFQELNDLVNEIVDLNILTLAKFFRENKDPMDTLIGQVFRKIEEICVSKFRQKVYAGEYGEERKRLFSLLWQEVDYCEVIADLIGDKYWENFGKFEEIANNQGEL